MSDMAEFNSDALLAIIPDDQKSRVFNAKICDINREFLGFLGIYERLSQIIPKHWTIVDLGCAYAPQAFLFRDHAKYVGVDLPWKNLEFYPEAKIERFQAPNTVIYEMSIAKFIEQHIGNFSLDTTFAICSYVPPWGGDNMKCAREAFKNVFTYYPAGGTIPSWLLRGERKPRTSGRGGCQPPASRLSRLA
jgi:hypothetical protein